MVMDADVDEQEATEAMLQTSTFVPVARPVTVELGLLGAVMTPEPEENDQVPTPEVGVLPARVVELEEIHSVWLVPALAIDVAGATLMVMVEDGAYMEG